MQTWASIEAKNAGFDGGALDQAIAFACAHDSDWPYSLYHEDGRYAATAYVGESGPWSKVVGPVRDRGGPAGMIVFRGRMVRKWGDCDRPDMTPCRRYWLIR